MNYSLQAFGVYKESEQGSALKSRDYKDATDLILRGGCEAMAVDCRNASEDVRSGSLQSSADHNLNSNSVCREGAVVRRLTPTECSRLQGYPDGWVDIGDWTDSNGKLHKESDTPKYKALGNSICLPFWQWLLKRISAQYERPATLGSLFSGIGGFEYSWACYNGLRSVRWASEVDPFCIAVTTKHFGDENKGIQGDFYEVLQRENTTADV